LLGLGLMLNNKVSIKFRVRVRVRVRVSNKVSILLRGYSKYSPIESLYD
jgi:hypothetical protein